MIVSNEIDSKGCISERERSLDFIQRAESSLAENLRCLVIDEEMVANQKLSVAFGVLGNVVSCMVFLAPVPTFYQIYKRKSAEGFQALPYLVALFSCMLWIYYAILKADAGLLLITINSIGIVIEVIYISMFIYYAPRKVKMQTWKFLLLLNVFGFGVMLLLTLLLVKASKRMTVLGWICLVFNISVFAAPLGVMKRVIQTKSVEYMPFTLSLFLTAGAVTWFFYGFFLRDYYIAFPNVLGFLFGVVQMVLYLMYKNAKKVEVLEEEPTSQELSQHITDIGRNGNMVCPEIVIPQSNAPDGTDRKAAVDDAYVKDQIDRVNSNVGSAIKA